MLGRIPLKIDAISLRKTSLIARREREKEREGDGEEEGEERRGESEGREGERERINCAFVATARYLVAKKCAWNAQTHCDG